MQKKAPIKIKKLLSGFFVGISTTSAVLTVVACGEDDSPSQNKSVVKVPANLSQRLAEALAKEDGIDNLPVPPSHSHWEYKTSTDKNFVMIKPKLVLSGEVVAVKLVPNEDYTLDKQISGDFTAKDTTQKIAVDDLAEQLTAFKLNQATLFSTLPKAPANSHWEYQVDNGQFSVNQPTKLKVNQAVSFELVPEEGYFLEDPIVRYDVKVTGIPVDEDLKTAFKEVKYGVGMGIQNLPTAPVNTQWLYSVNGGEFKTEDPGKDLKSGVKVVVKLAGKEGYQLTEDLQTEVTAIELVDSKDAADALANLDIGVSNFWYEEKLPPAPEKSHWEWQEDDKGYSSTAPKVVKPGTKISIKLVAEDSNVLSKEAQLQDALVVGTATVPINLESDLQKVTIDVDNGITNLPVAPENSHWEYKVADGDYSATAPTKFNIGEEVSFRLVNNANYILDRTVEAMNFVVTQSIPVPDALEEDLKKTTVTVNDGIVNLPDAPANAHWEYSVNGNALNKTPPTTFQAGQRIAFKLVADDNYVLFGDPVQRADVIVTEKVVLVTEALKAALNKVTFDPDSGPENVPPAPEHTFWEYKADTGNYDIAIPELTKLSVLAIRLSADPNYILDSDEVMRENITFNPNITLDSSNSIFNATYGIEAYTKTGIQKLPEALPHTHWEFQLRDAGEKFNPSTAKYNRKLPDISGKAKDLIDVKLFADENYQFNSNDPDLKAPHREGVLIIEGSSIVIPDAFAKGLQEVEIHPSGVKNLPPALEHTHWNIKLPNGTYKELAPGDVFKQGQIVPRIELGADAGYRLENSLARENILVTEPVLTDASLEGLKKTQVSVARGISDDLPAAPANSHWEYEVDGSGFTTTRPTKFNAGQTVKIKLVVDNKNFSFTGEDPAREFTVTNAERVFLPTDMQEQLSKAANNIIHDDEPALDQLPAAPAHTHWTYSIKQSGPYNKTIDENTILPYQGQRRVAFVADFRKFTIRLVADEGFELESDISVTTIVRKGIDPNKMISAIKTDIEFDGTLLKGIPNIPWPGRIEIYYTDSKGQKLHASPDDFVNGIEADFLNQTIIKTIPYETEAKEKVGGVVLRFGSLQYQYVDYYNYPHSGDLAFYIPR